MPVWKLPPSNPFIVIMIKMVHEHKAWYSRGYLPHFNATDVIQTINFRLADSLPSIELERLEQELKLNPNQEKSEYIEAYLDTGHGECWLKDSLVAETVQESFLYFDKQRYNLLAWVVMPNHVHVMIEMFHKYPVAGIVKSWKSFTAARINRLLGRAGRFWARDYFDRYIRNVEHYNNAVHYIHMNPVKAGLVTKPEDWPFSSAKYHAGLKTSGPYGNQST